MSIINLLVNDIWSEADIVAHGRAVINAQVSSERQQELQTIMLGHIAGMRSATPDELAEIGLVAQITEAQSQQNALARADMALLAEVLAYEADPTDKTLTEQGQALYDLRHPVAEVQEEGVADAPTYP